MTRTRHSEPDAELHRRLAQGVQGRDRERIVRKWIDDTCGGVVDPATLQALADGPIINPARRYLPLGKCSEEEWRRRNRI